MVRTTSNPSADGSAKPKPKVRIVSYIDYREARVFEKCGDKRIQ